jgi:uncharacterized phage protein (TIGR01671 family)
MQREIKFRAFDDGKMIYQNQTIMTDNIDQLWYFFKNVRKDAMIMQFTGLRDRNGKEIYENDIVKILYTDWMSKPENDPRTIDEYKNDIAVKGVVKFKDCEFGLEICSDNLDSIFCGRHGFIEIIGNTFEDVNLMQGVS